MDKKKTIISIGTLAATAIAISIILILTRKEQHQVYLPLVMSTTNTISFPDFALAGEDSSSAMGPLLLYGWNVGLMDAPPNFVRTVWCIGDEWMTIYGAPIIPAAQADFANHINRTWLVLNEPDRPDQCGGWRIGNTLIMDSPRLVAHAYHILYQSIKAADPNATIFVGGLIQIGVPETSQQWWTKFVDELSDNGWLSDIEGVHIHAYPIWSAYCPNHWPSNSNWCWNELQSALVTWHSSFHVGLGLNNRPIWITESGCAPFVADLKPYADNAYTLCRDNVMAKYQSWFPTSPYSKIFWFRTEANDQWWPTGLVHDGQKTPLGEQWISW